MDIERFEPVLALVDDVPFLGGRSTRATRIWRGIGLVALIVAASARALIGNGFTWGDPAMLGAHASWFQLVRPWSWAAGAYTPLSATLLWGELRLFGLNPILYHALTLAIHAVSALLVWIILRRLSVPGAWLAAAIFAVHPALAQSLDWLCQQPVVWCGMFSLLTIWMALRLWDVRPVEEEEFASIEPPHEPGALAQASAYGLVLLSCAAAVLSDPLGFSVPIVLILLIGWTRGGFPSVADWKRITPFLIVAVIGAALSVWFHHPSAERLGVAPIPSVAQRALIAMRAIAFYAANVAWPDPFRFVYARWNPSIGAWNALATMLLCVGFAGAVWGLARRLWWGAGAILAALLFVAIIVPGLVVLLADPAPAAYVADARAYLAMVVPVTAIAAILIAAIAPRVARRTGSERAARAIIGVVVLAPLIALSIAEAGVYQDELSPWRTNLARDRSDTLARSQYALALSQRDPEEALRTIDNAGSSAIAESPTLLEARARLCLEAGRSDDAITAALQCQRLAPDDPQVKLLLAEAYDAAGVRTLAQGSRTDALAEFDSALAACSAARQLRPRDPAAVDCAGTILLHEGLWRDAIAQFDTAIRLDAGFAPAHAHRAAALVGAGLAEHDEDLVHQAGGELSEALRIDPNNADAFRVAEEMDVRRKNWPAAEHDLRAIVHLSPGSAEAWANLGMVLAQEGRSKEALASFDKALKLRPDFPAALLGKRLSSANK